MEKVIQASLAGGMDSESSLMLRLFLTQNLRLMGWKQTSFAGRKKVKSGNLIDLAGDLGPAFLLKALR